MIIDITMPVIYALIITIIFFIVVYIIDKHQENYFLSKHPKIYHNSKTGGRMRF